MTGSYGTYIKAALCAVPLVGVAMVNPVLGAIGFTKGGIVGGSAAASFMASYGGAVTSGSICAICQSVGAAGLGTATWVGAGTISAIGGVAKFLRK